MAEITITASNFEEEVRKSDRPVLLDFWAAWCGPCRMLSPTIEAIAKEHPEIKVGKVNVDEESELANAFKVSSIPLVVLMKNGQIVKSSLGYVPKEKIEKLLEP